MIVSAWETHHHPRTMSPTGIEPWMRWLVLEKYVMLIISSRSSQFPVVTQHATAVSVNTMWSPIKWLKAVWKVMAVFFFPLPHVFIYLVRSSSTCQTKYNAQCAAQEEQPQRKQAQLNECHVMTCYCTPLDKTPLYSRKSSFKTSFMIATISASSLLSSLTPAFHLIPAVIARLISSASTFNWGVWLFSETFSYFNPTLSRLDS